MVSLLILLLRSFDGRTFCSVSETLYQQLGIVLFALEIEDTRKEKTTTKLLLNPADYIIPARSSDIKVQAFVMAKNKAQSDLTFSKHNSDSMLGKGINFSQLSLLASGLTHRGSIAPVGGNRVHPVHHIDKSPLDTHVPEEVKVKQAWQLLLRKNEDERRNLSETKQEEQQKLEDKYLRENYFVRDAQIDVTDAIIRSSISEEMPFVDNHIIIIGKALSNLYDLIRPLRAKNLGELKHIVIIYPNDFPPAVWQRISIFESVWIVRGSALEEADIRRAGRTSTFNTIFHCNVSLDWIDLIESAAYNTF